MEVFVVIGMFEGYMAILGVFPNEVQARGYLNEINSLFDNDYFQDLVQLIDDHISPNSPYDGEYIVADMKLGNFGPIQILNFPLEIGSAKNKQISNLAEIKKGFEKFLSGDQN